MASAVHVEAVIEDHGDTTRNLARITPAGIPGAVCDLWCYEDGFGVGDARTLADGALEFRHSHARIADVELTTILAPGPDSLAIRLIAAGPNPESVQAVRRVNACWQFLRSHAFGNRGHYVRDFVSRCFVHTENGITRLTDTRRRPDTRRPPEDPRNSPPWVQRYVPAWERHPGQPDASWGNSDDRPTHSLVGVVSRDGQHLAAWACRKCVGIGQGWHDCLHLLPDMSQDYDTTANRIETTARMYFLPNDMDALLARYQQDFGPES